MALIYRVRESAECTHAGQTYSAGEVFTPFEDLPRELQAIHVSHLIGVSDDDLDSSKPIDQVFAHTLTPEETVEVIDQETESPHAYDDVLL